MLISVLRGTFRRSGPENADLDHTQEEFVQLEGEKPAGGQGHSGSTGLGGVARSVNTQMWGFTRL